MPIDLIVSEDWRQIVCNVCKIKEEALESLPIFDKGRGRLKLNPCKVVYDFSRAGYKPQPNAEAVKNPGDFFLDADRREIKVRLLPAVYPHHIVGIIRSGKVVNIFIAGLSGRSGITIEDAKKLGEEIGLTDALIFDNGFDVIARVAGGAIIAHERNIRQTRLTAALHFGYLLEDPRAFGGDFAGFELATATCKLKQAS